MLFKKMLAMQTLLFRDATGYMYMKICQQSLQRLDQYQTLCINYLIALCIDNIIRQDATMFNILKDMTYTNLLFRLDV